MLQSRFVDFRCQPAASIEAVSCFTEALPTSAASSVKVSLDERRKLRLDEHQTHALAKTAIQSAWPGMVPAPLRVRPVSHVIKKRCDLGPGCTAATVLSEFRTSSLVLIGFPSEFGAVAILIGLTCSG
jgi:hypothetical protein